MRGFSLLCFFALVTAALAFPQPDKIYGVNIGSWLLVEAWMLPDEWVAMGGEKCTGCNCIGTEFALTKSKPDAADKVFDQHWQSWFTQADVQRLKNLSINTVRIPLGYWLVEPLVEEGEYYPKGGMRRLKEGLQWLKDADIAVILDHHALPGVASVNQNFAGQCTSDVQFYNPKNYHRALIWSAVMTFFSHVDPNFQSVLSIQAINEPLMNATRTPGYGQFQKDFVQTVRAVEDILGVGSDPPTTSFNNVTAIIQNRGKIGRDSDEVKSVLVDSVPMLLQMLKMYEPDGFLDQINCLGKDPLTTTFVDMRWQTDNPPNPADAKDGPQTYDVHLYYNFGGVSEPNPTAYLTSMCNLERRQQAAAVQNTPLWFGEWAISSNFTDFSVTDDFMKQWADAQKFIFSQSAGWIFWNFKVADSAGIDAQKQWSYYKGVELGYLTEDPAAYHDPNVCKPYIKT